MPTIVVPHTYHAQQKGYTCGPSTALVVLSTFNVKVTELQMERECKTTVDGTNDVKQITNVLFSRTANKYVNSYIKNDVPTRAQKDSFWNEALKTILQSRRGMPVNIWAPANNHPPGYPNYMIMHYISAVGIDTDNRRIYISDSARFNGIEHYWIGADKLCTMITPKGYGSLANPTATSFWDQFTTSELAELAANFRQLGLS